MHGVVTLNGALSRAIIISLLTIACFLAFTPLLLWNPIYHQLTLTFDYEIRMPLPDLCNPAHAFLPLYMPEWLEPFYYGQLHYLH